MVPIIVLAIVAEGIDLVIAAGKARSPLIPLEPTRQTHRRVRVGVGATAVGSAG
jgi:hypothetical protein